MQIGEILVEMGYLTTSQLRSALHAQALGHEHKLLGRILVEAGIITEEQLRAALAEQLERFSRRSRR